MRTIFLSLVAALALTSCVGIDSKMVVRADGSGTIDLTYRISQMIADLGKTGTEQVPLPLPVTREDFERGLAGAAGVQLRGFARTQNEKDIIIKAQISFDRVESLAQVAAFRAEAPSLVTSEGRHTLSQLIVKGTRQEMSPDSLQMMDTFFQGYAISVSVEAPAAIQSTTLGTVSPDKRTLTYNASVKDLATAKNDVVLSLTW